MRWHNLQGTWHRRLPNARLNVANKMLEGGCYHIKMGTWAGFLYEKPGATLVANSGLIVAPEYRKVGLCKAIKRKILNFHLKKNTLKQSYLV
jgi:hypothetical protein